MAFGFRSILDTIAEREQDRRAQFTARAESQAMRSWMRLTDAPSQSELNPTGRTYLQTRAQDKSVRPSRPAHWYRRSQELAAEQQARELRQIAQAFAPRGLEAQQQAFRGRAPQQVGAARAVQFGQAVPERARPAFGIGARYPQGATAQGPLSTQAGVIQAAGQLGPQDAETFFSRVGRHPSEYMQGSVLGPLDFPFTAAGLGAERGLEAVGAPEWAQQTGNIGAQLALGLATARLPTARLPSLVRPAAEVAATTFGAQPSGRIRPTRAIPEAVPPTRASVRTGAEAVDVGPAAPPPAGSMAEAAPLTHLRERLATLEEDYRRIPRTAEFRRGRIRSQIERVQAEIDERLGGPYHYPPLGAAPPFYHGTGTVEEADEILARGFRPNEQVHLTTDPSLARQFALRKSENPVVIEVRADPSRLGGEEALRTGVGRDLQPVRALGPEEAPPLAAGGASLTAAQVQARRANVPQAASAAIAAPARQAREEWRLFEGAKRLSGLDRTAWANDTYQLARRAGVRINPHGANQSDEVIDLMERAWERAPVGMFQPERQAVAQQLYDRLDAAEQRLVAADPDFSNHLLPDYFPHLFKVDKRAGVGKRGLTTRPGFARKRELTGPLGDVLQQRPDLDLVTWDPVDFVARHEAAVDNYIASLETIRGLKARGLIQTAKGAPADWRTPDISPFKIRQTLQGYVAEPKVATTLEQQFGGSAFDQHGALKLAKNVREAGFKVKVFGGVFQGIDYTFRDAGLGLSELARLHPGQAVRAWFSPIKAVARAAVPGLDARMTRLAAQNPKLRALYANGLSAGVDTSLSEQAIRGLGGIVPQTVAGRQIPGARPLQQVIEFVSGGAYQKFHTETLEQAGLINLEKHLRAGVPMQEAARLAAEETNVFFSSIPNWQSAIKSATGRDLAKFPIFATGEFEAWFRLPFQAPAGFAGIVGATVITAEMLNLMFTGKPLSKEQLNPLDREGLTELLKNPQNLAKLEGTGVYNTRFMRPELPWKGPDGRTLYLDLLGQADTPFRWALDPIFATQTRLGQLPRAAMDIAAILHGDRPMFGEEVESPADLAKFAAQQVSPISIAGLAGTERGRIGAAGAGIQVGGLNVSAEPINEVAKREFETRGIPFSEGTWRTIARNDPDLQHLVRESRTEQETQELLTPQIEDLSRLAERFRDDGENGPALLASYREYLNDAFTTTQTLLKDVDFGEAEGDIDKTLEALNDIQPTDFRDPEEGDEIDWGAYDTAREELIGKMPVAWREAYQARLRLPEELQDVEQQIKAAQQARDGLYDISKIRGVTPAQMRAVSQFNADVEAWRDERLAQTGRKPPVAAGQMRVRAPSQVKGLARRLSSGKYTERNRNPAYINYLREHRDALEAFYPELFSPDWVIEGLRRRRR